MVAGPDREISEQRQQREREMGGVWRLRGLLQDKDQSRYFISASFKKNSVDMFSGMVEKVIIIIIINGAIGNR